MRITSRIFIALLSAPLLVATGCGRGESTSREPASVSALPQRPAAADPSDWCGGCGVPESMCTVCNRGLIPRFQEAGDWCAEHGFPESVCPQCNPMQPPGRGRDPSRESTRREPATAGALPQRPAAADPSDWCGGCGVPESMCTVCNRGLIPRFQGAGDWCAEHGFPESVCPQCNPMQPPGRGGEPRGNTDEQGHDNGEERAANEPRAKRGGVTRIRFRSPSIERAAGIETVPASSDAIGVDVESTARIDFNRNRMADVRSPVPGVIRDVSVDLGQRVESAEVLFILESTRVGDLQARRLAVRELVGTAQANVARQKRLRGGGIASGRQLELAHQELETARAELRGIDGSLRISGASRAGGRGRYAVRAPLAGSVVRRPALVGSFAEESDSLATVADTSVMWALIDVSEWDAAALRVGFDVVVRVDGVAGQTFSGTLTWIASEVDPRTRTVTARAELENNEGLLRAGQFANATIRVATPESAVTIPMDAVQRVDDQSVVFVRTGEGLYESRIVILGRSDGRRAQVTGAVHEGDAVVTTGAFLLRTEMSRESIGAGCCEVGPRGGN